MYLNSHTSRMGCQRRYFTIPQVLSPCRSFTGMRRLAQRTMREDGDTAEWQDRLVDDSSSQETVLLESDE
jgi:hypothetical protein